MHGIVVIPSASPLRTRWTASGGTDLNSCKGALKSSPSSRGNGKPSKDTDWSRNSTCQRRSKNLPLGRRFLFEETFRSLQPRRDGAKSVRPRVPAGPLSHRPVTARKRGGAPARVVENIENIGKPQHPVGVTVVRVCYSPCQSRSTCATALDGVRVSAATRLSMPGKAARTAG